MIRAIAAIDEKRGIAAKGKIPWDIPTDVQYFREQTLGGIVLMGRETYEQFKGPLPNRRNVVASRSLQTVREGFELTNNAHAFLQNERDVWVIGGAGLYEALLDDCDELYITHINGDYNCDRFFPSINIKYILNSSSITHKQNGYTFTFAVYKRNR